MTGGAGGLLLLLPPGLQDNLEVDAKEHILALEEELLNAELDIPIYFAEETEELLELHATLTSEGEVRISKVCYRGLKMSSQGSEAATSAMAALLQSVSNSGYQLVVTAPTPQPVKDQVAVEYIYSSPCTTKKLVTPLSREW